MSLYYKDHGKIYEPEYERPGRTKQSFMDDCDINQILNKAQIAGGISHLQKHGAVYGDFSEAPKDLLEAREQLAKGEAIFNELPPEIRREFKNDPLSFFEYVNNPENKDNLRELLPAIAKPGSYFPDIANKRVEPNEPAVAAENTPEPPSGGEEA